MGPLILGKEEILRNIIIWVIGKKELILIVEKKKTPIAKRVLRKQAKIIALEKANEEWYFINS